MELSRLGEGSKASPGCLSEGDAGDLQSMLPALRSHALGGELEVCKAALLGLEAVGCHAVLLEMGQFEGTVSGLLTCCCDASREVRPGPTLPLISLCRNDCMDPLGHRQCSSQCLTQRHTSRCLPEMRQVQCATQDRVQPSR